jgi:hypothetical protein
VGLNSVEALVLIDPQSVFALQLIGVQIERVPSDIWVDTQRAGVRTERAYGIIYMEIYSITGGPRLLYLGETEKYVVLIDQKYKQRRDSCQEI